MLDDEYVRKTFVLRLVIIYPFNYIDLMMTTLYVIHTRYSDKGKIWNTNT